MLRTFLFTALLLLFGYKINAQSNTQILRGTVTESITFAPVSQAEVVCISATGEQKCSTDSNGYFKFTVNVGRHSILIKKVGFNDVFMQNLDVVSGKELVLNIKLEESIKVLNEAVITAKRSPKENPINTMTSVSGRQFSVEETQRYAAAVNDPARMALGFSGVTTPDDGNNLIIVRGNAPNGLIWRMEGMDIPNPNHFSNVGSAGGGITILSAQLLANSDFLTGAFPAEYGNGVSGVFDLKLRKGNNEKREHTFQIGVLGIDLASEGPLGKTQKGSYLVNYRFSTLSLLAKIVPDMTTAITNFQDLSYNVSFPVNKKATWSFFGFGGLSNQYEHAVKDSAVWKKEPYKNTDWVFLSNTVFSGTKYSWQTSKKHLLDIKAGYSYYDNGYKESALDSNYKLYKRYNEMYNQQRLNFAIQSNYKINRRLTLRSGGSGNHLSYNLTKQIPVENEMKTFMNISGNTNYFEAFSQAQYRPNAALTLNAGFHTLYLQLNGKSAVEPRFGLKYNTGKRSWVSAGFGVHNQILPIGTYFYETAAGQLPNKTLNFSKAKHFVVGYDKMLSQYWHLKTEVYYQQLSQLPVATQAGSSFCLINTADGFFSDTLVSRGTGKNMGVELTIEKFFAKNTYVLFTTSLSDSKYKDYAGREFSTRYNVNHTLSLLAGKEWYFGKNRLGINFKILWVGGMRQTPVNIEASNARGEIVMDEAHAFTWQNPDYLRIDSKISYKINRKKHTSTWSLDFQNTTNRKNVYGRFYDVKTQTLRYSYQTPLLPVLSYKIEF